MIERARGEKPDLLVVNRFGRLESEGAGMIAESGAAVAAGEAVLIAVQGAERYWCRHGFVPDRAAGMSGFGDSAIRMTRVWTGK